MISLLCIFLSRQMCSTILAELILKQRVLLSLSKEDCISRGSCFRSFNCSDNLHLDVHRKSWKQKLCSPPWMQTALGLPDIKGSLKLRMGYIGINLKKCLGTRLCRDEMLMKHFSVITLCLSGKRKKWHELTRWRLQDIVMFAYRLCLQNVWEKGKLKAILLIF